MNHVLFITGEFPPQTGGVGAYTAELGKALLDQGLAVSVVTSRGVEPGAANLPAELRVHNVVDGWHWRIWGQIAGLADDIRADWLHVQYQTAAFNMNPAINFAPRRWKRMRPTRGVAWTYHDLLVPYLFPKAGERLRRWITLQPALTSDQVVATNEGDRLQLHAQGVPSLHRIAIGSNIQGQLLSAQERQARRLLRGYADEDQVLAYFGFLNRSKGGLTLVRAFERLAALDPTIHLLMIGERVGASDPTNHAYLQEVEQRIAQAGLAHRVQWTGHQDDAEVGADLNACDVLVMPYLDGASLRRGTLMAGLANGCAMVTTTPQSPLPELTDGRELLYVAPENDLALANVVRRLLDNPGLAQRLRANARRASARFDWQTIAAQHVAFYTGGSA